MATCPNGGFTISPTNPNACIVDKCPSGFDLRTKDGVPACIYTASPESFFTLKQTAMVQPLSIYGGRAITPTYPTNLELADKTRYDEIVKDYQSQSALTIGNIDKTKFLQDKFKALQSAENVREQAPEAYQSARIDYYTTLNGVGWVDQEKERITKAEVEPKIQNYQSTYTDLISRLGQQQQTYDIISGVKDKMISMKDDFQYTTKTFSKQIEELKSQINIERNRRVEDKQSTFSWLDTVLNLLIVIITLVAIVIVARKMIIGSSQTAYTSGYPYY